LITTARYYSPLLPWQVGFATAAAPLLLTPEQGKAVKWSVLRHTRSIQATDENVLIEVVEIVDG
jgi:hypothetical protein